MYRTTPAFIFFTLIWTPISCKYSTVKMFTTATDRKTKGNHKDVHTFGIVSWWDDGYGLTFTGAMFCKISVLQLLNGFAWRLEVIMINAQVIAFYSLPSSWMLRLYSLTDKMIHTLHSAMTVSTETAPAHFILVRRIKTCLWFWEINKDIFMFVSPKHQSFFFNSLLLKWHIKV